MQEVLGRVFSPSRGFGGTAIAARARSAYDLLSDAVVQTMVRRRRPMLQAKPISPASGRPMSDRPHEDAVPSAPAITEESATRTAPPPTPGMGGRTAPAPRSQRRDRGAGAVGPLGGVEEGVGSASDWEAGAEVEKEVGSWRGRLTARDRELVGHLGLVSPSRSRSTASRSSSRSTNIDQAGVSRRNRYCRGSTLAAMPLS